MEDLLSKLLNSALFWVIAGALLPMILPNKVTYGFGYNVIGNAIKVFTVKASTTYGKGKTIIAYFVNTLAELLEGIVDKIRGEKSKYAK